MTDLKIDDNLLEILAHSKEKKITLPIEPIEGAEFDLKIILEARENE